MLSHPWAASPPGSQGPRATRSDEASPWLHLHDDWPEMQGLSISFDRGWRWCLVSEKFCKRLLTLYFISVVSVLRLCFVFEQVIPVLVTNSVVKGSVSFRNYSCVCSCCCSCFFAFQFVLFSDKIIASVSHFQSDVFLVGSITSHILY